MPLPINFDLSRAIRSPGQNDEPVQTTTSQPSTERTGPRYNETPTEAFVPSFKIKLVEEGLPTLSGTNIRQINDTNAPGGRRAVTSNDNFTRKYVILDVTPEFSESGSVSYAEIADIRQAASILIYMGSPGRSFSINAKFVSRTPEEAGENYRMLQLLKSWRTPDKQFATALDSATPRVVRLYAYGNNIKGIPTVMKSINIDFPVDCDYISTADNMAKMPIIFSVSMQFQETRNAKELEQFDIEKYKTGQLQWW